MLKKHAYLIMAHNRWEQLKLLLKLIDDERNDIYIHIDKKVRDIDSRELRNVVKKSGVFFVPQIDVQWAGYSMVECELNLIKKALERQYSYLHLLSGVDLPLKRQDEIHSFFEKHAGKEFIQFNTSPMNEMYMDRIKYYHFLQEKSGRGDNIWGLIEKISIKVQKMVGVNRLRKCDLEIQKGTNWFSITSDFAKYVIEKSDLIKKYFSFSISADEMFMQTVLVNSKYKYNLYNQDYDNNHYACLRKIDWNRGNPYVFKKDDYEELVAAPHLWARKFDDTVDNDIIKMIEKHLGGE